MNWHEELLKRGFVSLESSTRTYGNGSLTGSVVNENWDGKFLTIADKPSKTTKEIFCPFLHGEENNRPNLNHQTIRLRNTEDLNKYLYGE